ncbi:MAG: glycosyltransferase family 9 protein [Desulfobacterales bacterium]|nr:glycosyltransferase family 9 protein [Desulfobacterales bacterium]
MNIRLQRKIDRTAGSFLCGLLSLLPRREPTSRTRKPERILVIILSEMGSLALARPMFETIRQNYPTASLSVLMFEKNREFLEILDLVPAGNILTIRDSSLPAMALDSLGAIKRMRRQRIDTVIDCELFSRISSIFSFMSGARIRVGFHPHTQEGLYRGSYINRPVPYNPYQHISQQFVTMADAIESDQVPRSKRLVGENLYRLPPAQVGPDELKGFNTRLHNDFPAIADRKLVLLYPGGGLLPIRAWPIDKYCRVAAELIRQGHTVGIIGLPGDKETAARILAFCRSEHCIDLTGYTVTVREVIVLFNLAALLITNDGGPGHFAALTPIPFIIFYGPETPVLYAPLAARARIFYVPLACSPCLTAYNHRDSPCDGNNLCLRAVRVKEVLAAARELLGGPLPGIGPATSTGMAGPGFGPQPQQSSKNLPPGAGLVRNNLHINH